eukprot:1158601-Pelagomonas_calceolata.AAC.1
MGHSRASMTSSGLQTQPPLNFLIQLCSIYKCRQFSVELQEASASMHAQHWVKQGEGEGNSQTIPTGFWHGDWLERIGKKSWASPAGGQGRECALSPLVKIQFQHNLSWSVESRRFRPMRLLPLTSSRERVLTGPENLKIHPAELSSGSDHCCWMTRKLGLLLSRRSSRSSGAEQSPGSLSCFPLSFQRGREMGRLRVPCSSMLLHGAGQDLHSVPILHKAKKLPVL